MLTHEQLQKLLSDGQFEFSLYAFRRAVERDISDLEICEAGKHAMIIEDYPDDKYAPSCLLLGFTKSKRPIHLQVSRMDSQIVKIITLYEPDHNEWTNYKRRRQ